VTEEVVGKLVSGIFAGGVHAGADLHLLRTPGHSKDMIEHFATNPVCFFRQTCLSKRGWFVIKGWGFFP
jgi:hypothetical protein